MSIQQYPTDEYTETLCAAAEAYDYPAVTYDFELENPTLKKNFIGEIRHCKCKLKMKNNPEYKTHRACMRKVESEIYKQLTSENITEMVKGLGSIYYWGRYNYIHSRSPRHHLALYNELCKNKSEKLEHLSHKLNRLQGPSLVTIEEIGISGFNQMSMTSKMRMFLDPKNYVVLDKKIADNFARFDCFPPLRCLHFNRNSNASIHISSHNEKIYEQWSAWCSGIAHLAKAHLAKHEPSSPLKDIRAADVERGIYKLSESTKGIQKAWRLLACPEGWTHDQVVALGRQTEN